MVGQQGMKEDGGEGGIRTIRSPMEFATYRLHVALAAISARIAVALPAIARWEAGCN